jgi:hypothetical protein
MILKAKGAKVQGDLKPDPLVVEDHGLPDGSGYSLVVGVLKVKGGQS